MYASVNLHDVLAADIRSVRVDRHADARWIELRQAHASVALFFPHDDELIAFADRLSRLVLEATAGKAPPEVML